MMIREQSDQINIEADIEEQKVTSVLTDVKCRSPWEYRFYKNQ